MTMITCWIAGGADPVLPHKEGELAEVLAEEEFIPENGPARTDARTAVTVSSRRLLRYARDTWILSIKVPPIPPRR
jgi:hypothetical protein